MTIFQKRENGQFTLPASLSSAPAVVNSFVTIVCMDSTKPYIFIHSKNMGIMYYGGYKVYHPHPGILLWGVKRGEYEMFYGSLTAEFNEYTDLLIEGD